MIIISKYTFKAFSVLIINTPRVEGKYMFSQAEFFRNSISPAGKEPGN